MEDVDGHARPANGLSKRGFAAGKGYISKGLTNGNGLTNGKGKRGLINGNGATNGLTNGLTNGMGSSRNKAREPGPQRSRNILVVLALAALLFISAMPYLFHEGEGITGDVDGKFDEWKDAVQNDALFDSSADLLAYSSRPYYGGMEFYAEARDLFEENSTVRALVDTDSSQSTGYLFEGAGIDYLVEISGYGGEVLSARAYEFNSSRSQDDWNGFDYCASPVYALSGDRIEFGISAPTQRCDVYIVYSDFEGAYDVSDSPVSGIYGIFEPLSLEAVTGSSRMGTLHLKSMGEHRISDLRFLLSGTYSSQLQGELRDGTTVISTALSQGSALNFHLSSPLIFDGNKNIELWISPDDSGETFKLEFFDIDADCSTVATGSSPYIYAGHIPAGTVIDGGFHDWQGKEIPAEEDTANPNIDPEAYAFKTDSDGTYIYLRVKGEILKGSDIPRTDPIRLPSEKKLNITIGYGKERPLPPMEGKDFAYLYINADGDNSTGQTLYGGADLMLRFSGRNGLKETESFVWEGAWVKRDVAVKAYADGSAMEAYVPENSSGISIYYYMVDWSDDSTEIEEMVDGSEGTRIFVNGDFQISFADNESATQPDIAVDPRDPNYIYVVWSEIDEITGIWEIHFSMSDNGGKDWSNDEDFEGDRIISAAKRGAVSSVGDATMPAIVVDEYENIHVIWREDYGNGSYEVHYSYSTDFGKTWSSDSGFDILVSHRYDLPGSLDGEISSLDLATLTDSAGDVYLYAFWTEYIPETREEEVRFSWSLGGLGNTWSAADGADDQIISLSDGQFARNVSATAYMASGAPTIFVVWDEVDENTGMSEIHFSSSSDGGKTWTGLERDQILSYPDKDGRNARNPCITGYEGILFVLWQQELDPLNGSYWTEIFYSFSSDNGVNWSGTREEGYISYPDKNPAVNVSAAIIPGTKEAHVVWEEFADEYGSREIHHSYFDGISWSGINGDEILSNPDRYNASNPSMVWSPAAGKMEIVWSEPNPPKASSFEDEIIYSSPVPEFGDVLIPMLFTIILFIAFSGKRKFAEE